MSVAVKDDARAALEDITGVTVGGWLVCGWFTPDYKPWADKLIASLDRHGLPHNIVEVPKLPGTWEVNTMAKPAQILAAMDRHPGRTLIFLDVDCEVRSPLNDLVASVSGMLGFTSA